MLNRVQLWLMHLISYMVEQKLLHCNCWIVHKPVWKNVVSEPCMNCRVLGAESCNILAASCPVNGAQLWLLIGSCWIVHLKLLNRKCWSAHDYNNCSCWMVHAYRCCINPQRELLRTSSRFQRKRLRKHCRTQTHTHLAAESIWNFGSRSGYHRIYWQGLNEFVFDCRAFMILCTPENNVALTFLGYINVGKDVTFPKPRAHLSSILFWSFWFFSSSRSIARSFHAIVFFKHCHFISKPPVFDWTFSDWNFNHIANWFLVVIILTCCMIQIFIHVPPLTSLGLDLTVFGCEQRDPNAQNLTAQG